MSVLSIERPGIPPERLEIPRAITVGGSHADDVHVPSWPPGALRLEPCAAGVVAEPLASGVRVGGRPVAPGTRRLVRVGERAELHGIAIGVAAEPEPEGTRAAAAALLRAAAAGAAPLAGAHLVVLSGPAAGTRLRLGQDQTLGRGRAATLVIADPRASRVHARIRLGEDGATVEDLRSKNGVRVNGVRIERRPCRLRAGDELCIGETALALVQGALAGGERPARRARAGTPRAPAPAVVAAALLALSAAALALVGG